MKRRFLVPVIAFLAFGGLLSVDILDEIWGGLPDPGCITPHHERDEPLRIELWQGVEQTFGERGIPQEWYNIQGRVDARWGVSTLSYTLNNRPRQPLSIGASERRLACEGDFNIEIPTSQLTPGPNQITITAIDRHGNQIQQTISLKFIADQVWPLPYAVDWDQVSDSSKAVQVVDGQWALTADGIRTKTISYDRAIVVGDLSWENYEITVPFIIHSVNPIESPSNGAGLGIIVHWNGHSDEPIVCEQPRCGWWDKSATAWYGWDEYGRSTGLLLSGYNDTPLAKDLNMELELGTWYDLRLSVDTSMANAGEHYRLKIWPSTALEPQTWTLIGEQPFGRPESGSLLLVAHHVDITFGNLEITTLP